MEKKLKQRQTSRDGTKTPFTEEPLQTHLRCPCCGGEVIARPVFTPGCCGVRIVAQCRTGCAWSATEQHEMDRSAGEEMFQPGG